MTRISSIGLWLRRVWGTFVPSRSARDIEDELQAHLALAAEEAQRTGTAPADVARAARGRAGAVPQTMEAMRDQQALPWLRDFGRDMRYAVRVLRRSPVFTTAAVVSLALGIGATTAAFSVVRTILLNPLPYADSDRLARIVVSSQQTSSGQRHPGPTYDEFVAWRSQSTTLESMAAQMGDPQVLTRTPSGAARLAGAWVSPEWFDMLGVRAMLGRTLQPSDIAEGRNVVVLTARAWRERFGADPDVVGQSIVLHSRIRQGLEGQSFEVVGVMPDTFQHPASWEMDFWVPLATYVPGVTAQTGVSVLARLVPGATLVSAQADAGTILTALRGSSTADPVPMEAETLKELTVTEVRPVLRVLMASAALVLLIVCANVAGLLLARGTARRRELAIRLAIGAGRARIVRQLLAESAVLSVAGGLAGALVAAGTVAAIRSLATIETSGVFRLVLGVRLLPRVDELTVDANVLMLALALSVVTALLCGIAPAAYLSRPDLAHATSTRAASPGAEEHRARSLLVVGQLAVATAMLVGATLLARSYVNLLQIDTGYDPTNVLAFQLVVPEDYPTARKAEVIETVLARLRATPGVRSAGFSYSGPLIGVVDTVGYFVPPGRTAEEVRAGGDGPPVRSIGHGFLGAISARVVDGRAFDARDDATAPSVVVLNRAAARQLFGEMNPVGATLFWHGGGDEHGPVPVQVVGVVDDVRNGSIRTEPRPEVLFDYRQIIALQQRWQAPTMQVERVGLGFMSFAVRSVDNPWALARHVREAVLAADPNTGIDAMAPLEHLRATSVARPRFYAAMLGLCAAIAGVLAAVGIYGLLSYAVAQRTHEIGVRMALGADSRAVLLLVLRRGLVLAGIGITAGLAGAAGLSRWLASLLYGLTPVDAATYALVAAAFAAVTLAACYFPARRATRVEPATALRCE